MNKRVRDSLNTEINIKKKVEELQKVAEKESGSPYETYWITKREVEEYYKENAAILLAHEKELTKRYKQLTLWTNSNPLGKKIIFFSIAINWIASMSYQYLVGDKGDPGLTLLFSEFIDNTAESLATSTNWKAIIATLVVSLGIFAVGIILGVALIFILIRIVMKPEFSVKGMLENQLKEDEVRLIQNLLNLKCEQRRFKLCHISKTIERVNSNPCSKDFTLKSNSYSSSEMWEF